jgi:hypothetical protein
MINKCYKAFFYLYFFLTVNIFSIFAQSAGYHYVPVVNKNLGIWPDNYSWDNNKFPWLHDRWGFTKILIISSSPGQDYSFQYINAIAGGFNQENLLMTIWRTNYQYAVDNFPVGSYYIGEAVEHDCSGKPTVGDQVYSANELTQISNYIKLKRPDSKLVIDGYKRCSHLIIAGGIADKIMYSSYVNWDELNIPVCHVNLGWGNDYENPWLQGSSDQSGSWSDMKQKFGDKFSMSWMKLNDDDYSTMFQTANELGLETIWLYAYEGVDSTSLESFCQAAINAGWLQKVEDVQMSALQGSVIYKGTNEYGLAGCTITLTQNGLTNTYSTTTDSSGDFIFNNLPYGEYNFSFNYNGSFGSVNATDALMALRYYVGLENLDELQLLAADVNNNGVVNSTDALFILQRFVGLITEFPNNKPDWIFQASSNPYLINQPSQSIIINCLETGDVNRSLHP